MHHHVYILLQMAKKDGMKHRVGNNLIAWDGHCDGNGHCDKNDHCEGNG